MNDFATIIDTIKFHTHLISLKPDVEWKLQCISNLFKYFMKPEVIRFLQDPLYFPLKNALVNKYYNKITNEYRNISGSGRKVYNQYTKLIRLLGPIRRSARIANRNNI